MKHGGLIIQAKQELKKGGNMKYKKGNMMRYVFVLLAIGFLFTSCKFITVNPSLEAENYRNFGTDIGIYLKTTEPKFVVKSKAYIEGALRLSDEELLSNNVLQVAYEYALEQNQDDAALILLIKSMINTFGIKIDASTILPDERPAYVANVRALLQAYSNATKGVKIGTQ